MLNSNKLCCETKGVKRSFETLSSTDNMRSFPAKTIASFSGAQQGSKESEKKIKEEEEKKVRAFTLIAFI